MQTPPPYQQPQYVQPSQPPKNNSTKIVIIVLACVFGFFCLLVPILAAILFPVFSQAKNAAKNEECIMNLRQICNGASMYAAENDNKLPLAENWNGALDMYTSLEDVFHCPGVPHRNYGYAYNDSLSGLAVAQIAMPQTEPMIFDSNLREPNAHSDLSTLSTSGRHMKTNIGYVDGHVESRKPERLK